MDSTPGLMTITSNEARIKMREALDAIRRDDHVIITRYGRTEAVMVAPDWYEEALDLMVRYSMPR